MELANSEKIEKLKNMDIRSDLTQMVTTVHQRQCQ